MKPWFEKELDEADIIKFPEPEAKVVQMPNVQEYPDFITGVQDLQAKQKDGAISQESYDKLYTELIHRFMKKESFETPWFIREAPKEVNELKHQIIQIIKKSKNVGNVEEKGNKIISRLNIPKGQNMMAFRKEFLTNLASFLQKQKIDAHYDSAQTHASTVGEVNVKDTNFRIFAKDAKLGGGKARGMVNELELVRLIKNQLDKVGKIDIIFRDDRKNTLEIKGANAITGVGKDTKNRKKADAIISSKEKQVPISLKKKKYGFWESADRIFGARAKVIIDNLVKKKVIRLQKTNEKFKVHKKELYRHQMIDANGQRVEIVVEPTAKDVQDVVFGSDISPAGGIVVQDFQKHHFILEDNKLYVDCYAVIKTIKDIPEAHIMYWLIFNKPRNSTAIGVPGIAPAAVTMTRAFGAKRNFVFVDQKGKQTEPPPPRNPQV